MRKHKEIIFSLIKQDSINLRKNEVLVVTGNHTKELEIYIPFLFQKKLLKCCGNIDLCFIQELLGNIYTYKRKDWVK